MFSSAEDLLAAKEDQHRLYQHAIPRAASSEWMLIANMRDKFCNSDIYSAMQTYRMTEKNFTELYTPKVKAAPRRRYHGSLPQPMRP